MSNEWDKIIAEWDALIESHGRLMFAKENYDDAEANTHGVRLLDFLHKYGPQVRAALASQTGGTENE